MGKTTKKLAIMTMLSGIAAVITVAGWNGRAPRSVPGLPPKVTTGTPDQEKIVLQPPLTQNEPDASRVSVSFNDDTASTYTLLKGVSPIETTSHHPDIDVWYGQYSEQDYRGLPASPVEKEPSRLNVKISFAF